MGRLVVFDNVVQEKVNAITKEKLVHTGLLIGQSTQQKDIVVRLCPTPPKDDDLHIEISNPAEGEKSAKKESGKDTLDLDEQWICLHAKQVARALAGGLDVLGFYVAVPAEYATKNQAQIRQILFSIYKTVSRSHKLNFFGTDRILLNICTSTFKCICRTYDIADIKSTSNPAEWKILPGTPRWHRVECQLAVDLKFPIRSENTGMSLQRQIEIGLKPFFKSITLAQPLVNGIQRDLDEILDTSHDGKKAKQKTQLPQQCFGIELFIPLEQNNNICKPQIFECVCMMTFKGIVQNRAYIHSKATVKEGVNALKQDIIRSITARCEIHCEDLLLIDEEQQDPLVVHELPRRVFAPLPQEDLCVCDYQFHGDSASDSLDAFKELLDLDITEQDVDTSCETSPTTSTLILPEVMEDRLSEFGGENSTPSRSMLVPMAGAAIAAVAAGMSYFFLHYPEDK